ncbi:integral membrane protein [Triangularia verruculosa]|uniref:Integral membrane protein n=1 Tax=Triangularia verruculosa TaxID=2587418 RepID=A0AAN6XIR9_9PEZI|nr:integral membrane protein [Triangularia verruculosa]
MDNIPDSLSNLPPEIVAYDIGPHMVRAMIAMTALTVFVVLLRMGVRWRATSGLRLGVDDWLMFAAALFLIAFAVTACLSVYRGGVGRYTAVNMIIDLQLLANALFYFCFTLLLALKLSILAMYLRIFPTRFMKLGVYVTTAFVGAWYITAIFVTIFQCILVQKAYMPYMTGGYCVDNINWLLGSSIPNIIQDIMILFLPVHEIWKLHLPRPQKIGISAVFLLGVATIIVACIRVRELVRNIVTGEDISKALVLGWILTGIEPAVGMITGSLPTLTPLLRLVFGTAFGIRHSKNQGKTPGRDIETIGGSNRKESKGFASYGSGHRRPLIGGHQDSVVLGTVSNDEEKGTEAGLGNQIAISTRSSASPGFAEIPLSSIAVQRDFRWSAETVTPPDGPCHTATAKQTLATTNITPR